MLAGDLRRVTLPKRRIVSIHLYALPKHSAPYQAGPKQRKLEREEVVQIEKAGVAEPVITDWASSSGFVPKKNKSFRFCVSSRPLDTATVRDSYSIQRIDEGIVSLGEAKLFITWDASSGYWQTEMDKKDFEKTAFVIHNGLYEYTRMSFRLKNDPATFLKAMDVLLASVE